jgi:hypothetical protein
VKSEFLLPSFLLCFFRPPDVPISRSPDYLIFFGSFDTLSKPFKIDEYFPSQAPVFVWRLIQCRSGGIGRRAWFRSMYSQGCGGSSPFFGTNPFFVRSSDDELKPVADTNQPRFDLTILISQLL